MHLPVNSSFYFSQARVYFPAYPLSPSCDLGRRNRRSKRCVEVLSFFADSENASKRGVVGHGNDFPILTALNIQKIQVRPAYDRGLATAQHFVAITALQVVQTEKLLLSKLLGCHKAATVEGGDEEHGQKKCREDRRHRNPSHDAQIPMEHCEESEPGQRHRHKDRNNHSQAFHDHSPLRDMPFWANLGRPASRN